MFAKKPCWKNSHDEMKGVCGSPKNIAVKLACALTSGHRVLRRFSAHKQKKMSQKEHFVKQNGLAVSEKITSKVNC